MPHPLENVVNVKIRTQPNPKKPSMLITPKQAMIDALHNLRQQCKTLSAQFKDALTMQEGVSLMDGY
jgi:DNA-directed RNA polymerase subunit L